MAALTPSWRQAWASGEAGARLRWQARQGARAAWRSLGWTGVSLLLLAAACAAALALSAWQHADLERLRVRQAQAPAMPRRAEPVALSDIAQDRVRLQAFLTGLPSHRDIPSAVQTLLTLADQHGVSLIKGDYQFQPDAVAGFARYRMALPLQGGSTQVRRFVSAALNAQPSLGIESLQLRREQAQTDQIEARLEWVLYTRLPESVGPAAEAPR